MTYRELFTEYLRQYKFLAGYVKNLNKEFNKICENLDFKEKIKFKRRIYLIYTMALELKHNAEYLQKCTRREETNCQNRK